jgi:hypothetical protein
MDGSASGPPGGFPPALATNTLLRFVLLQEQHRFLRHAPAQTAANVVFDGRPGPFVCAIARLLCASARSIRPSAPGGANEERLGV